MFFLSSLFQFSGQTMSLGRSVLNVSGVEVEVIFKAIKHLHLSVYPPHGRVRVAAPILTPDDVIRNAVIHRLDWIRRHRQVIAAAQRQSKREMLSGESHYVWGKRYLLDTSLNAETFGVHLKGSTLWLTSPESASPVHKAAYLDRWYRTSLRKESDSLLEKWCPRIGVERPRLGIRRMKTKWGTYSQRTQTIWLNSELAKKSPTHLEYVLVHELLHFVQPSHGPKFAALMDQFLPDWNSRRRELNSLLLAFEDWRHC
jgi:predicted metal-dependent hydrolase